MPSIGIHPPYPEFNDANGRPLENGYIWIGAANTEPQTNQIPVYWDEALTAPAAQPIRTLAGYSVRNGSPARFYATSNYSIKVVDSKGRVVYSSLNNNLFGDAFVASNATGNGAQTIFAVPFAPSAIFINGVYQNQNTYTVAGGNVTFSAPPPLTSVIEFLI